MKRHIVRQGECLYSIAVRYGTTADALHNHEKNSALKEKRPDPSVLAPGDLVWVPSDPPQKPSLSSGGTHRFKAAATIATEIQLQHAPDHPVDDKPYRLRIGQAVYEGRTTGEGVVEAKIPVHARTGELTIWPGGTIDEGESVRLQLGFGSLDPITTSSGLQGRLENLGFGGADDVPAGLAAFQSSRGLEVTGELDDATRDAITSAMGE